MEAVVIIVIHHEDLIPRELPFTERRPRVRATSNLSCHLLARIVDWSNDDVVIRAEA